MASARIQRVKTYPVKGARGQKNSDHILVDPMVGVVGDRRFGIKRSVTQPDEWAPKTHFRVCMNTSLMAAEQPVFVGNTGRDNLANDLDKTWLRQLARRLGQDELSILDTQALFNLVDTDPANYGATISFLNLATVRAVEQITGWNIDPERFRMNVWYDNDQPFSELEWADNFPATREFQIGKMRFRIQDACERCRAIEANPQTGRYDLALLDALEGILKARHYGGSPHRGNFHVMGFLATPLNAGSLKPGQEIQLT